MKRSAATLTLLACLAVPGVAAAQESAPDSGGAKPPKEREYSYIYNLLDNSVIRPITRGFDVAMLGRKLTNNRREAYNVDELDQVRLPSTWWQPRIGFRPVSVEQMLKGPGSGAGPAPGKWTITKAKTQGVTPGFQIKDSKSEKFIIKFDPPAFPELASSVDVIGSYFFWAAGYNVPDNTIAYFRPEDLEIDEKATMTDPGGKKVKMTPKYLQELLGKVARQKDGRYRCLASAFLKGKPLGPFQYVGRRKDDTEDLVPHELRRELRGLWTMAAWVNHADMRGPNSLDMWVTDDGRSFVRHHLIDFGSILGSSAYGKHSYVTGTEYYTDYKVMGQAATTLGLIPFRWESVVDPEIPAVGFVEAVQFDPDSWRTDFPNPAFDERTERDVRWGAKIVAGFTDEHIRAAVSAARYSNPRAAETVTQILIQRRDKLVQRWLGTEPRLTHVAP